MGALVWGAACAGAGVAPLSPLDLGRAAGTERAGSAPARGARASAAPEGAAAAAAAPPLAARRFKTGRSGMAAGRSCWRAWRTPWAAGAWPPCSAAAARWLRT
eukprot:5957265-Alexandrium_andersonii.AAC.1